jgi:CheY-like chemotaxis protein
MDGYGATTIIKSMDKGKQTPIVALTASTFEDERKRIEALKMQGYIRKPFKDSDLFNTIGKILSIKYIYEDDILPPANDVNAEDIVIDENIAQLPDKLVTEMLDAIAVADLDQLMKLISSIEPDYPQFAQQLLVLAKNYNYNNLEQILNERRRSNER